MTIARLLGFFVVVIASCLPRMATALTKITSPFGDDAVIVSVSGDWRQFSPGGQEMAPASMGRLFFVNIQSGSAYYSACAVVTFPNGLPDNIVIYGGGGNDVFQPHQPFGCASFYWRPRSYAESGSGQGLPAWRNGRTVTLRGEGGNDRLEDTLQGSSFIYGGAGNDDLMGNWEGPYLDGGSNDDRIRASNPIGGIRDRILLGQDGIDCLDTNNDETQAHGYVTSLACGAGADKFFMSGTTGYVIVDASCELPMQTAHCMGRFNGNACDSDSECDSGGCFLSGSGNLCAPQLLFIVGSTSPLSVSDQRIVDELQGANFGVSSPEFDPLRFKVVVRTASALVTADALGKALVVVSESVNPNQVGSKLTSTSTPVLCLDPEVQAALGMTGGTPNTDHGTFSGTQVNVVTGIGSSSILLKSSLNGNTNIIPSGSGVLGWGEPGSSATVVSRQPGPTTRATSYKYDRNATLKSGIPAPGRRAFIFLQETAVPNVTSDAWKLFDALVRWASLPNAGSA
jgi:RTX calcium-binding nonapeptide repeat (4 copies)